MNKRELRYSNKKESGALAEMLSRYENDPAMWDSFRFQLRSYAPAFLRDLIEIETRWSPEDPPPAWDSAIGLQITLYDNWRYNDGQRPTKARRKGAKSMPNAQKARFQIELQVFNETKSGKWWFLYQSAPEIRAFVNRAPRERDWMLTWAAQLEEREDALIGFCRSKVRGNGTKYHRDYLSIYDPCANAVILCTPEGSHTFQNPTDTTMDKKPLFDGSLVGGKVKSSAVAAWRLGRNPHINSKHWASHPWLAQPK